MIQSSSLNVCVFVSPDLFSVDYAPADRVLVFYHKINVVSDLLKILNICGLFCVGQNQQQHPAV